MAGSQRFVQRGRVLALIVGMQLVGYSHANRMDYLDFMTDLTDEQPQLTASDQVNSTSVKVYVRVETKDGVKLGKTLFRLTTGTTVQEMLDQAIYPMKVVSDLMALASPRGGDTSKGWLKNVLLMHDGLALVTDSQLQEETNDILKDGTGQTPEIVAHVSWAEGSPPYELDPELLQLCIENDDLGAAADMVKDHLNSAGQLTFISDMDRNMPETSNHGSVFHKLKELASSKVQQFRESEPNQQVVNAQKEERDSFIKNVGDVRAQLKPFVDEMKAEANDRAQEAADLRDSLEGKVQDLLNSVKFGDTFDVPREVPTSATSEELLAFVQQIDKDLQEAEQSAGGDVLDADELIWNSRVLRGIYMAREPQPKAQDLVQVIRTPNVRRILSPPESAIRYTEQTTRSKSSLSRIKKVNDKVGESFASSFSAAGGMITPYGIGAFSFAGKIASNTEETTSVTAQGRSESSSYYKVRSHFHPMQLLELDNSLLRFTPPVINQMASIIRSSQHRWPQDIRAFFRTYGTHYCPSVELGGIWSLEAGYEEGKYFSDTKMESAMSQCLEQETKGSGGFTALVFSATASGARNSHSCNTSAGAEATEASEISSSTRVSRSCTSNAGQCPTSDKVFTGGLRTNGNWAVIDRKMNKCVSLWDALRMRQHQKDLIDALAEYNIDSVQAEKLVDQFSDVANKLWHLSVLDLPDLCANSEPEASIKNQCKEMGRAVWEGADALSAIPIGRIIRTWEEINDLIEAGEKTSDGCEALDFCHNQDGHGACVWKTIANTRKRIMSCECEADYIGERCETKLSPKSCTETYDNECTMVPIDYYQPPCDEGWERQKWSYCKSLFRTGITKLRAYYTCKRDYTCEPEYEGHDCCPDHAHGRSGRR